MKLSVFEIKLVIPLFVQCFLCLQCSFFTDTCCILIPHSIHNQKYNKHALSMSTVEVSHDVDSKSACYDN